MHNHRKSLIILGDDNWVLTSIAADPTADKKAHARHHVWLQNVSSDVETRDRRLATCTGLHGESFFQALTVAVRPGGGESVLE